MNRKQIIVLALIVVAIIISILVFTKKDTNIAPETPEVQSSVVETSTSKTAISTEPTGQTYILNTNSHKFHYPSCSSVDQMNEENKQRYTGSRDDIIAQGYVPCKRCKP